jgi:hypothetical protein
MRLNRFLAGICGPSHRAERRFLRVNQETGPEIVLFRQGFARFDRANIADDLTIRRIRIHTVGPKREQIRDGTPAMQCVLRDRLRRRNKARPRGVSAVVKQAVVSNEDAHATACSCSPSFEPTRISAAPEPQLFSRSWGPFFADKGGTPHQ